MVHAVGEETGTREAVDDRRAAVPRPGRGGRTPSAGPSSRPGRRGRSHHRRRRDRAGQVAPGRRGPRRVRDGRVGRRLLLRAEPYGPRAPTGCCATPCATLLGVERGDPGGHGARPARRPALASRPTCCRWLPCSLTSSRSTCPRRRRPTGSTRSSAPTGPRTSSSTCSSTSVPGRSCVVVEEAHWADGASAGLLDRLAFATAGRPWAVVVVRRGEAGGFVPATGTTSGARPAAPDVVERLVIAATEATPLRPHEIAAIVERAEGNPLFVEEVTRARRRRGLAGAAARVGPAPP